jgi:hypothetical protein
LVLVRVLQNCSIILCKKNYTYSLKICRSRTLAAFNLKLSLFKATLEDLSPSSLELLQCLVELQRTLASFSAAPQPTRPAQPSRHDLTDGLPPTDPALELQHASNTVGQLSQPSGCQPASQPLRSHHASPPCQPPAVYSELVERQDQETSPPCESPSTEVATTEAACLPVGRELGCCALPDLVPRSVMEAQEDMPVYRVDLPDCLLDLPDMCHRRPEAQKGTQPSQGVPLPDLIPLGSSLLTGKEEDANVSHTEELLMERAAATPLSPSDVVKAASQTRGCRKAVDAALTSSEIEDVHPQPRRTAKPQVRQRMSGCLLSRTNERAEAELWQAAGHGLKRIADRFAERAGGGWDSRAVGRSGRSAGRGENHWGADSAPQPDHLPTLALSLITKIAFCVVVKKIYNVLY